MDMDQTVNDTRTRTNEWNQRAKLQQIQPTKRTNECTQSLCHRMVSPRQTLTLQRRQRAKMNEQLNEHHHLNQGPIHNHVSTRRVVAAVCCDSGAVLTPAECMYVRSLRR